MLITGDQYVNPPLPTLKKARASVDTACTLLLQTH
jgi:hypothetical protein